MSEQIIQGETFSAVIETGACPQTSKGSARYLRNRLAKAPTLAEIIERQNLRRTPFQQELERTRTQLQFSKYPDGTLRLFKPHSIISDEPAGYSEEKVSVKVLIKRPSEEFMVVLTTTRQELDKPNTEEKLAIAAYNWRRG